MSGDRSATENDRLKQYQRALARWDNEGGAEPNEPQAAACSILGNVAMPENGSAEVATLQVRVIAFEKLVLFCLLRLRRNGSTWLGKWRPTLCPDPAPPVTR